MGSGDQSKPITPAGAPPSAAYEQTAPPAAPPLVQDPASENLTTPGALPPPSGDTYSEAPKDNPFVRPRGRIISGIHRITHPAIEDEFETLGEATLADRYALPLALGGVGLVPGTRRYDDLGDRYQLTGLKAQLTTPGVRNWRDLANLIRAALRHKTEPSLEFVVHQYVMPDLVPPPDFLKAIQDLSPQGRTLTLVFKGHPLDPPQIVRISGGQQLSEALITHEASSFWTDPLTLKIIRDALNDPQAIQDKFFFEALLVAQSELEPGASLGNLLTKVVEHLQKTDAPIPLNKRTQVFSRLASLQHRLRLAVMADANQNQHKIPPGVLWEDPVTQILKKHPPNINPDNSLYSMGAGQMVALLHYARRQMDEGTLPLDFRLMADNRSAEAIWELNTHGTRREMFKDLAVNPPQAAPIYVMGQHLRRQALSRYQTRVILINLKADQFISSLEDTSLVRFLAGLPQKPVLVSPAKSFVRRQGQLIPYSIAYDLLQAQDAGLAARLTIMGGFFEAPGILKGIPMEITLASEDASAAEDVSRVLSPTLPNPTSRRADWKGVLGVKLIASRSLALFLNGGGAIKNFTTYLQARFLLRGLFNNPPSSPPELDAWGQQLGRAKKANLSLAQEIMARLAPFHAAQTVHLWAPKGLERDIFSCLPPNIDGLLTIMARFNILTASQTTHELPALIESIRSGLGGGTRNARDGYIDEILAQWWDEFKNNPHFRADYPTVEAFYDRFYPVSWKGDGAMEGRKGIGPLVEWAADLDVLLPQEAYTTWTLYNPTSPLEYPGMPARIMGLSEPQALNTVWGLHQNWVRSLQQVVRTLIFNLDDPSRSDEDLTSTAFFIDGLHQMRAPLEQLTPEQGTWPLVTERLLVIKDLLSDLESAFRENHLGIGPTERQKAKENFQKALSQTQDVLRTPPETPELLLDHLRGVAISLFEVMLAIQTGLRIRYGLAETQPAPIKSTPVLTSTPRPTSEVIPTLTARGMAAPPTLEGLKPTGAPESPLKVEGGPVDPIASALGTYHVPTPQNSNTTPLIWGALALADPEATPWQAALNRPSLRLVSSPSDERTTDSLRRQLDHRRDRMRESSLSRPSSLWRQPTHLRGTAFRAVRFLKR